MTWERQPARSPGRAHDESRVRSSLAAVEAQQLAKSVVIRDVRGLGVGVGNSGVERSVGVGEPLRALVVEVRERALPQRLRGVLVARNRPPRVPGDRLVHPVDPFRRVEPPVPQLDEPPGVEGDPWTGGGAAVSAPSAASGPGPGPQVAPPFGLPPSLLHSTPPPLLCPQGRTRGGIVGSRPGRPGRPARLDPDVAGGSPVLGRSSPTPAQDVAGRPTVCVRSSAPVAVATRQAA